MSDLPLLQLDCFLCKGKFAFGPHVYRGDKVHEWDIWVCHTCRRGNYDGIVPLRYPHLVAHLKERGIETRLTSEGWICWPWMGA
jgi:hypothetical protein